MRSVITRVEVDTEPDGALTVRWAFGGEPVAVDVASGPTADGLDHEHETTVPAGQTTLRLRGRGDGRRFVSVAPHGGGPAVIAADRRVVFETILNFRDLGGYLTTGGAAIRWGLVFRADSLHGLTSADLRRYQQLGLRAVYDLRGDAERTERPNPMPSRALALVGRSPDSATPDALPPATTSGDGERILRDLYVRLIDHAAPQIGELYSALIADDGLPAVFHCHAGKDRTGVAAALLLDALGVDRDTILDDYELTARYRLRTQQEPTYQRLLEVGLSPEAAAGVLTTPRWAMSEALSHVDRRYGGIVAYLIGPARMRPEDVEGLRRRLLSGPPGSDLRWKRSTAASRGDGQPG